jgi:hypothetical protein
MIWFSLVELAIEANGVIASRMALMATGAITANEAQLMITEKMFAAAEAGAILASGGNVEKVMRNYRRRVRANGRRLNSR